MARSVLVAPPSFGFATFSHRGRRQWNCELADEGEAK